MKQAIRYERMSQDALDEAVREAKDDEASALNGRGRVAQIAYLTRAEPASRPLDGRELATVLAALRHYQRWHRDDDEFNEIATNCGTLEPLTAEEIDALCERLNSEAEHERLRHLPR